MCGALLPRIVNPLLFAVILMRALTGLAMLFEIAVPACRSWIRRCFVSAGARKMKMQPGVEASRCR